MIWYLGGGGGQKKLKKSLPQKSEKKLWKMWAEKFVVEIDENYVDQKKHQMVTYIIGKTYDKKCIWRNIKKNNLKK